MAENEEAPVVTNKPRKRKAEGRQREKNKLLKHSSHSTGLDCKCTRLECFQVVKEAERARLIQAFNALPSKDAQDSFLAGLITVTEVNRRRPRSIEPKSSNSNSYNYKVFVTTEGDAPEGFAYVCFKAFLSIFGIKKGRLETIKKSLATTGEPPRDQRGRHMNRPHKMSDQVRQMIHGHISSFRGRQSHYSQEKTRRLYLPDELNINKMFELFKVQYPDVSISYETYRTVFNNDFNIGFGYPRTDTCSKCDEFKMKIDTLSKNETQDENVTAEIQELKLQRDLHQRKADTFYKRKREARLRAQIQPNYEAFTFDYQKNLNVPNQTTNDFYYRRKLTFQSFNVHKLSTNDVFVYGYDETVAKKGSDEVASMLYHHFMSNVDNQVQHIELFCDSCAGQNKNYTLIRLFDYLVNHKKRFQLIRVTFPERGHSYMECDRDMGLINTKAAVSLPSDWINIFRSARQQPSPFNVIEVKQEMVKNFTGFLRPLYKNGCPVPTRPLREMYFSTEEPGVMTHRDSWNGLFLRTNITCTLRRKKTVVKAEPEQLYKDRLPISTAKFNDLQVLKKFASNEEYFDSLPHEGRCEPLHEITEDV